MKVDLNGKVALVTGAGRNIGKAIADALAQNGARVVYADIDLDGAKESAAQWPGCRPALMNVTDTGQVHSVIETIVKDWGRLDILVNNAGINTVKHRVNTDEFPREEWDKIMEVDLTGVYTVSRTAAQVMVKQGSGKIINISSVVGLVPLRLQCAFAAAKAGVVNFTKAMAIELGSRGILVNCIAPGSVRAKDAGREFYGKENLFKELVSHIPLGRTGTPEEIAHAALFLAAPESSYINGSVLTVDGGWTAGYMRDF
jgi:3-oxoacyl-[acyl-carrier protein] reductase